jgi:hypothetical protein
VCVVRTRLLLGAGWSVVGLLLLAASCCAEFPAFETSRYGPQPSHREYARTASWTCFLPLDRTTPDRNGVRLCLRFSLHFAYFTPSNCLRMPSEHCDTNARAVEKGEGERAGAASEQGLHIGALAEQSTQISLNSCSVSRPAHYKPQESSSDVFDVAKRL